MRILVTGVAGFIGSNMHKFYKHKGNEVTGWDIVENEDIVKVDMMDIEAVKSRLIIDKPELIIHCAGAADVNKSIDNPMEDYSLNVTITHNVLFALQELNMLNIRFVYLSSAAVYGNPTLLPIKEDSQLNPISPYALHKVMCENICFYMNKTYGLDVKILRVFSAYGKGLKKQIFWDMYKKALTNKQLHMFGTGNESRDYINIKDLINAIYLISTSSDKEEIVYNVANGEEMTIRHVAECFADVCGMSRDKIIFGGENREGNPINWKADITKLKALGYTKTVNLKEGVEEYYNWAERNEDTK